LFRNTNLFTASSNILTPLLNDPNPATALNILGNGTANNPATLQKLFIGENLFHFGSHLTNFVASFDGPVFSLPAGDVKLAVGAAYRIEQQMEDIGSNTGVLTNPLTLTFREQDRPPTRVVESLYAEVAIPLVSEKNSFFLFHKLDLSLSGRYDDYSDVGQTTNPKIGLDWVPVDDLKIHSSWSTSFRAPVVDQLLNNEAAGNAGVLAPVPGGQLFGIILTGGNPNLTPEKSRGDSLGADYNPSWLPGFGLSTNYFYVDFYSKIGQVAGSNGTPTILSTAAMQALYAPYINLNPTRAQVEAAYAANNAIPASTDPTLVKFIIDGRSNNIGISIIRGMDFTGHYFVPTDWGVFGVQESGIFYFQYLNSVLPGAPVFENINQINFPTKFTSKTQFSWDNGSGLHVGTFVTFMPPYLNNLISPSQKVSSYTQVDLQLNYQFAEGLSWIPDEASWLTDHAAISLSVLNLFNQTPPYVNNTTGLEYDPQNVTAEGRVVSIELVKKLW
jgi:iron complex outermembrane receptor protein